MEELQFYVYRTRIGSLGGAILPPGMPYLYSPKKYLIGRRSMTGNFPKICNSLDPRQYIPLGIRRLD